MSWRKSHPIFNNQITPIDWFPGQLLEHEPKLERRCQLDFHWRRHWIPTLHLSSINRNELLSIVHRKHVSDLLMLVTLTQITPSIYWAENLHLCDWLSYNTGKVSLLPNIVSNCLTQCPNFWPNNHLHTVGGKFPYWALKSAHQHQHQISSCQRHCVTHKTYIAQRGRMTSCRSYVKSNGAVAGTMVEIAIRTGFRLGN